MFTETTINLPRRDAPWLGAARPGSPAERVRTGAADSPRQYWDRRANSFAGKGAGLAAVCSYGMPWFYNAYIHHLQRRALEPWIAVAPGESVLEIGCGIGRWSRRLARAGASVVGLDLSPAMLDEARRRAREEAVDKHCRFLAADVAGFRLNARFNRILGVTVLQHVLDPDRFQASIDSLAAHLAPGGRAVLLEVAPSCPSARCDSAVFTARSEQAYLEAFHRAGLRPVAVCGVDPAPFRTWFLPWYRSIPRPFATAGMFAATLAGLPFDLASSSSGSARSWHKVFVLAGARSSHEKARQP